MTRSVLVVDDDAAIRTLLMASLQAEGFSVTGCANGAEALAALSPEPDLVVLDLQMPVMNGREFLHAYKDRGHAAPVLILSAEGAAAAGEEFHEAAMNKPFDLDLLLAVVDRLTARTTKESGMNDDYMEALRTLVAAFEDEGSVTYDPALEGYLIESGPRVGKMSTGIAYSARLSRALERASDLVRSVTATRVPLA